MKKQFNILLLTILILGQTILGPAGLAWASEDVGQEGFNEELQEIANESDEGEAAHEGIEASGDPNIEDGITAPGEDEGAAIPGEGEGSAIPEGNDESIVPGEDDESAIPEVNDGAPTPLEEIANPVDGPVNITVTDVKSILKINGEEVSNNYDKELEKGQKSRLELEFTTSLLNGAYTNGSWFEFTLPASVLQLDGDFHGSKPATGDHPAYKYTTTGQTVRVELDGDADPIEFADGDITFKFEFDARFEFSSDEFEQTIVVPDGVSGTREIILTFVPSTTNEKMTKSSKGVDIRNGERFLKWEIWVNRAGKGLSGATLNDIPGTGHVIDGNITIESYAVNLSGVNSTATNTDTTKTSFPIVLPDGRNAYKITYETKVNKVNPSDTEKFTNSATFTSGSTTESANSEVSTTYGKALDKKLISGTNYESKWEINFNYNQASLTGAKSVLKDTLPGVHVIDKSSIKVYKMTIDEEGKAIVGSDEEVPEGNYTISDVLEGFSINIGNTSNAYKILYTANLADDFFIGGSQTLKNTVEVDGTEKNANHTLSEGILTKDYQVDFDKKEIIWIIKITADNKAITNLTLEDRFSDDTHTYVEDSLKINDIDSPFGSLGSETGFDITGINIAKGDTATITYKTKYPIKSDGSVDGNKFSNTAKISWTSENPYTLSKTATYVPQPTTVNNGSKSGSFDYVNQLFNWRVKINVNKQDINGAKLTDTLGIGHELVEGTFKVQELKLPTGDSEADTGGTLGTVLDASNYSTVIAPDKKSFVLQFNNNLATADNNKAYQVTYQTKDPGPIIGIEGTTGPYTNSATFTSTGPTYTYPASVIVTNSNKLIDKVATPKSSSETYSWVIKINESFSKLGNVILKDQPSDNLMLLPSTIQIREMKIDANNGTITQLNSWVDVDASMLTLNSDGGFALNLGAVDKKSYQVRYETLVLGEKDEPFNNSASIQFDGATAANQETTKPVTGSFVFSSSDTSASSTKGNALFKKVTKDPITGEIGVAAGVQFQIIKQVGNIEYLIKTATSGVNGEFTFEDIRYGSYFIREVNPPAGYKGVTDQPFTMNAEKNVLVTLDSLTEIVNTKEFVEGDVCSDFKMKVNDTNGTPRKNLEVILTSADGVTMVEHITNTNGELSIPRADLPAGTYEVKEKSSGNVLKTSQFVTYTKKDGNCEVVLLQPENTCTAFTITVKGTDGVSVRAGIEVTLKKGNTVVVTKTTDENGQFTVSKETPHGDYTLYEGKQFLGAVKIDYNNDNCKFELQQAPTCPDFILTVRDVDGKNLTASTIVTVKDKNDETRVVADKVTTDSNGKLSITNLQPSEYNVYDENDNYIGAFAVNINCEAEVQPAPTCSDFTLTVKGSNNQVLANTKVSVKKDKYGSSVHTGITDASGKIKIPSANLPAGEYYVFAGDLFIKQLTVSYLTTCEATAQGAPVCEDFTLTVQDAYGNARPAVEVTVKDSTGTVIITDTTNASGLLKINTLLPQGTYTVHEDATYINSFTVTDTCAATVKPPYTGGGGWYPPTPVEPEDPNKPGTEDPNKPGPEDPNKPGTEDPNKPGPEDPNKPGTEDPNKPGPEDPNKPGTEDPNKPGTEDPNKPGAEDPDGPTKPGTGGSTDPNSFGNSGKPGQQNKPGDSETTVKTSKPGQSSNIANPNKNNSYQWLNGKKLPQTGEAYPILPLAGGLLLVLAGLWLLRSKKKYA